jgi:transcription elongation factor Elf1
MATEKKTRGWMAPCPHCGETASVSVCLAALDEFHCGECDADFSADEVRVWVAAWGKVLAWIDQAPVCEE